MNAPQEITIITQMDSVEHKQIFVYVIASVLLNGYLCKHWENSGELRFKMIWSRYYQTSESFIH